MRRQWRGKRDLFSQEGIDTLSARPGERRETHSLIGKRGPLPYFKERGAD